MSNETGMVRVEGFSAIEVKRNAELAATAMAAKAKASIEAACQIQDLIGVTVPSLDAHYTHLSSLYQFANALKLGQATGSTQSLAARFILGQALAVRIAGGYEPVRWCS